jgi:lipid-A-disaccharide synthase
MALSVKWARTPLSRARDTAAREGTAPVVYTGRSTAMPRLLVCCGEPSGDLYAAELIRHVRERLPGLEVFGLGGDRLLAQGAHLVAHVRDLAVVGLLEVVSHLPRLRRVFRRLLAEVDERRPDLAVLVDYPDFNLRLARQLRKRDIPVLYYVSPQVWAWRRGRVRAIRETVSRMLVIFPFEEAVYREAGVPVTFVGHPLVDLVRPTEDRTEFLRSVGLDPDRPVVAVLPGSRRKEVAHNLSPLAAAAELLAKKKPDLQFLVAMAPSLDPGPVARAFAPSGARLTAGTTHAALAAARVALVASGTATVEAALLGVPMVVVYRVSPLTYALGRPLVTVPHFAMVNLVAGRPIVPELMQADFTPERVAAEAAALLDDGERYERTRRDLEEVRRRLGSPGASARAAAVVIQALGRAEKP